MAFDFRNLEVYKKAKEFHYACLAVLDTAKPANFVKDQLGRASMSIVLNIAEGSGKFSNADRRNFYVIARASVFECVAVIDILNDQKKITLQEFESLLNNADELSRMLYRMIQNLSTK